ncbi:uncharacterized protein PFLUO_LOCUS8197 [Penicillium psychrofluorescens]|uniref:uncharacterized protein n=1 Tax=Penicillium psychrofluorescens TaxID=3158075 RepID=UPI003CCE02C6
MAHVSDDTAQDIAQAPASKRRRVAVACDACRTRKSRCDGNRPLCSLCRDLGFDCVYTPPTTATNVIVQKDYLHGLEDRVRNLENSLSTVKNDIAGLFTKEDRGAGRVLQPSEYEQSQRVVAGPVPDLTGTEDSVDAMGAITFANEEDSGFFGIPEFFPAMATITAVPDGSKADTRIAESDVFYQRGLGLCGSEILRGATLEVVQFLLLMGQYLQGTQKSIQAWTVHGLAVKGALQLGLHSRNALKSFTNLEQETRKRTWYGCVLLDRTLSMTFGRPAAIPDSYVKLDLPVKHDFEKPTDFVDDETSVLKVAFFNATMPVLVKFIAAGANPERDPQDLKLLQQIGMNSLQICADSAMAIIDIVHQVVTEPSWKQSLLGAWWFSLYYTFNAALVIIGTVWVYCDTSVTGTTMAVQASKAKQYPSRAVAALSKLDEGNRLIDRCRHYLETFDKALNDPETHDVATASFHGLTGNRNVSDNDLTFSPFGMELGEFMMDGDLVGMMDRQEILPEPGTSYPA